MKPSSFDWLEGFTNNQANSSIKWISDVSLEDAINKTTDISAYCEFGLAVGDRATEAIRIDTTSNFFAVVLGSANGGERCLLSDHKGQNEVCSLLHWPCSFSMIRATRPGALVAMEQAMAHVQ